MAVRRTGGRGTVAGTTVKKGVMMHMHNNGTMQVGAFLLTVMTTGRLLSTGNIMPQAARQMQKELYNVVSVIAGAALDRQSKAEGINVGTHSDSFHHMRACNIVQPEQQLERVLVHF